VALLASALGAGGCASAGLAAAGPMLTVLQRVIDRTIERSLPADLDTASLATVDAFARLGIRVRHTELQGRNRVLEGVGEGLTVRAELEPVTLRMTKLSVRVEAGRVLPDKESGEEILNQVSASLAATTSGPPGRDAAETAAQTRALAALEAEIRRLGSKLEENQATHRGSSDVAAPSDRAGGGGGVFAVPSSYGVPTVPGLSEVAARPAPATTSSRPSSAAVVSVRAPVPGAAASAPASAGVSTLEALVVPLSPVDSLAPIQVLSGAGNGR
jgi:hypothetical protein